MAVVIVISRALGERMCEICAVVAYSVTPMLYEGSVVGMMFQDGELWGRINTAVSASGYPLVR
jgi:hypothetical protein